MIYFNYTTIATDVFHFKIPRLGFSFLPPVSLKLFSAGFSSRISIFPTIDWPLKSDYFSLEYNPKIAFLIYSNQELLPSFSESLFLHTSL